MKRSIITVLGVLSVILVLGACTSAPKAPVVEAPVAAVPAAEVMSYSVRYNPNNATGGTVPQDTKNYPVGAVVEVRGNNENTLVNTGFAFNGWSTKPDGLGDTYDARGIYGPATFIMGNGDTQLYAVWADPLIGPWNLTSVNGQSLILAQKGFQSMTLLIRADDHTWTITSKPVSGAATTSTGTWAVADSAANYRLISGNIVVFNAMVSGSTLTLTPTSVGTTQVMVFSK